MKKDVMDTVNTLLQRSGQSFPAKNLSREHNSVQVYDVEHWPDVFNTLLIHDFPSIVVSFDTSTASLSGFVVTLKWRSQVDASVWVGVFVHILCMVLCLSLVMHAVLLSLQSISLDEIQRVHGMYMEDRNNSTNGDESSLLTKHIRAVLAHNEL
jgi:hypothetical protein